MKKPGIIPLKIYSLPELLLELTRLRLKSKSISFTNGCFDILHEGHIATLSQAATEADFLVVGINSDESTRRLKGTGRPVNGENARALVIASLLMVDAVVIFEEDTPLNLITAIRPDVLVKGGDYTQASIVGAGEVMSYGGRVVINPTLDGFSTTGIIEKIRQRSAGGAN
ncbi:D-glycero-beta-D-manno-heptose 1-phosphate adenylyltransferase [Segetibacter sp. 3557_3]|uniref:D-glycero-beta-D-manno-heptose 1-phosphate adenylyltransferase n=1 Tax=Segetibacter sp. 3557_3 TaxID=2547429 RepID=UPI001058797F|nr:D-glycero-beta-D-manno-heptose 1-phosphate adenylyltransferase [Segetibacter sp. 3557_3]TDH28855.1 D-glycero-beta-D-manno-heptose 1-phosphate adenylyltransferase [Segetibacter sp. 3557_3]